MTRPAASSRGRLCLSRVVALATIPLQAPAEDTMEPSLRGEDRVISLPYGFWTESFGAAAAYVYARQRLPTAAGGPARYGDGGHDRIGDGASHGSEHPTLRQRAIVLRPHPVRRIFQRCRCLRRRQPGLPGRTRRQQRLGRGRLHHGQRLGQLLPPALQVSAAHRQRARPGAARVPTERRPADRRGERRHRLESTRPAAGRSSS